MFTIRTRNNLVQFGIDFLVKLVSLDYLFPLFDALGDSGGSQGDLFEHGSEKGLQKVSDVVNFEGPFWSSFVTLGAPWRHLGGPRPQKRRFFR